jgi:hypothetical protein
MVCICGWMDGRMNKHSGSVLLLDLFRARQDDVWRNYRDFDARVAEGDEVELYKALNRSLAAGEHNEDITDDEPPIQPGMCVCVCVCSYNGVFNPFTGRPAPANTTEVVTMRNVHQQQPHRHPLKRPHDSNVKLGHNY